MYEFQDELEEFARNRDTAGRMVRRGGRPRLPDALQTRPFSLRLTTEERRLVAAAAKLANGIGVPATWARAALLEAARRALGDDSLR